MSRTRPDSSKPSKIARASLVVALAVAALLPTLAPRTSEAAPAATKSAKTTPTPDTISIDELLRGFAKMPGLYAEFRQESHMGLLAEPLVDEGTLHFADGRLARRITAPTPSVVVMDERGIEYGDGHTSERIDLAGKPALRQFVDAFTKIFAGDEPGLEALYRVEITAGPAVEGGRSWTMTLTPKVSPMKDIIAKVEVEGVELAIAKMRVVEIGGDETINFFSKVDTKRKYSKAEKAALFSVQ
ncbi:outer membrane lipoprotein carrier protein LolA [Pseudenhygromyxa sp. WMMC2535]|uniref:outer membrane lipoprotein carrier protein LolA n=1 Tax=Pseudenhygromyxa sp. WMMC2535 TaxID=2712867 RepID=UPI001553D85D|nr:outer membrane lipoprotein carrier protein LolA [Pseudenhygromyxa sp. WMMC2535]NVB42526.1 outer membrane lipoprotein carrier protein LolA [Pseudenhygromyxa sp. WMMC2535]